jgi:hypothetical protein
MAVDTGVASQPASTATEYSLAAVSGSWAKSVMAVWIYLYRTGSLDAKPLYSFQMA